MEMSNYGDVAKYVATLSFDFSKSIPKTYIQMIFDFFIQVSPSPLIPRSQLASNSRIATAWFTADSTYPA